MDLTTRYLGLELRNPLVASAGPLTSTPEGIHALADAGVGAVVLPSVFGEQLRRESDRDSALASAGSQSQPEAADYLPGVSFDAWPYEHLLLRHGPGYAAPLLDGLRCWMRRKGFTDIGEVRGLLSAASGRAVPARAGYLSALDQAVRTFA
jgi:dihydroorotate dehydrogenase (fumarate)